MYTIEYSISFGFINSFVGEYGWLSMQTGACINLGTKRDSGMWHFMTKLEVCNYSLFMVDYILSLFLNPQPTVISLLDKGIVINKKIYNQNK